jgi:hypothetical protein
LIFEKLPPVAAFRRAHPSRGWVGIDVPPVDSELEGSSQDRKRVADTPIGKTLRTKTSQQLIYRTGFKPVERDRAYRWNDLGSGSIVNRKLYDAISPVVTQRAHSGVRK